MSSALRLHELHRSFPTHLGLRRRPGLRGLTLELPLGSALGLVGPNGSGKSTLLRILAGVDRPSEGEVAILGSSPASAAVRARLAYLPEDSPFPPELSARSAMDLLGALAGMARRELRPRAARLLERVGLGEHAGRPLRSFSRGMLRRFGLAQAFLADPELVLLDEPTAGLDAQGFEVLESLLGEARERGATVVLASHLLADVHRHCDRLAILLDGKLAAFETRARLLDAPGRTRLEVEGLDGEGLGRLEEWVAEQGGRLTVTGPGTATLLELYRRHSDG